MEFSPINLVRMSNAAVIQFHDEIDNTIVSYNPETLKIAELFSKYRAVKLVLGDGFQKVKKSLYTDKMINTDKLRNQVIVGMSEIMRGNTKSFNPVVVDAASELLILIKSYGKITTMPIHNKTASINNLIEDLSDKYLRNMELLNLENWTSELKRTNDDFIAVSRLRLKEGVGKTDIVVKTARKQLEDAYNAIIRRIEAYIEIDGISIYSDFVKEVNLLVSKFGGSRTAQQEDDTTDDVAEELPTDNTNTDNKDEEEKEEEVIYDEVALDHAEEWMYDVNPAIFKVGDLFYTEDSDYNRTFYVLIDHAYIRKDPRSQDGHLGWKKLDVQM